MSPPVSVIMTVYNGEAYIHEAVASILAQTYSDFELIVIDDHSTDRSARIVESFADPRVRLVRLERHIGRMPALNLAVREARGRYIAILDADDYAYPRRLARQMAYMSDHPDVALVAGNVNWFDADGRVASIDEDNLSDIEVAWKLIFANTLAHSSVMMRREVVLEQGGYDESFHYGEDYNLYCAIICQGLRLAYLRPKMSAIRLSTSSMTHNLGHRFRLENIRTRLRTLRHFLPHLSAGQLEGVCRVLSGDAATEPCVANAIHGLMDIYSALSLREPVDGRARGRVQADLARRIALLGWSNCESMPEAARAADKYLDELASGSARRPVCDGLSQACLSLAIAAGERQDREGFKSQLRRAMALALRGSSPVVSDRSDLARLLKEGLKTSLRHGWWLSGLACGALGCLASPVFVFRKGLSVLLRETGRAIRRRLIRLFMAPPFGRQG